MHIVTFLALVTPKTGTYRSKLPLTALLILDENSNTEPNREHINLPKYYTEIINKIKLKLFWTPRERIKVFIQEMLDFVRSQSSKEKQYALLFTEHHVELFELRVWVANDINYSKTGNNNFYINRRWILLEFLAFKQIQSLFWQLLGNLKQNGNMVRWILESTKW